MPFADPRSLSNKKTARGQTPKVAGTSRPMIMSDEEKRQLIMAHAANRKPADRVQQFSLIAGVFVCAMAIGLGWLYSVRQSMANIFPAKPGQETVQDSTLKQQYENQIRTGAEGMIKQVEKIETEQLGGGFNQLIEASMILASTTNMLTSSSTLNTLLNNVPATAPKAKSVKLPVGVTQD
jgi:hypothetical protein